MSIIAKEGNQEYKVLPVGNYPAVCYAVWDLGYQQGEYKGVPTATHKIVIAWEVSELMETDDKYNGKRYVQSAFYSLSLGKKSNLRKDIEAWLGRSLTEEESKSFDVETMVGKNCLLNIIHDSNGRARVGSVTPLMKGMAPMKPENSNTPPNWIKKFQADQLTLEQAQEIWAEAQSMKESSEESQKIPF